MTIGGEQFDTGSFDDKQLAVILALRDNFTHKSCLQVPTFTKFVYWIAGALMAMFFSFSGTMYAFSQTMVPLESYRGWMAQYEQQRKEDIDHIKELLVDPIKQLTKDREKDRDAAKKRDDAILILTNQIGELATIYWSEKEK